MAQNGASPGRQVYRCGNCGRYCTHGAAYTRPSAADREQAVAMHGAGVSQSAVARPVGVTPPAVHRWVKKGALPRSPGCAAGDSSVGKARRSAAGGGDCLCCNVDLPASAARG